MTIIIIIVIITITMSSSRPWISAARTRALKVSPSTTTLVAARCCYSCFCILLVIICVHYLCLFADDYLPKLFFYVVGDYMKKVQDQLMNNQDQALFVVSLAHLMNNRVGEVVDEVDGLGHVHRRLQLVLLRQLQQLPGERRR